MSRMFLSTPSAQGDARVLRLIVHLQSGGDPRTPPADWRPTYPLDDPRNEPDLWVADLADPTLWCKRDDHEPQGSSACSWCGGQHHDTMSVYTFMLPEDY